MTNDTDGSGNTENDNSIEAIQKQVEERKRLTAERLANSANNNTPEAIKKQVEELKQVEAEWLAKNETGAGNTGDSKKSKLSTKFIQECLRANELGDGMLFAKLHQGKFLYITQKRGLQLLRLLMNVNSLLQQVLLTRVIKLDLFMVDTKRQSNLKELILNMYLKYGTLKEKELNLLYLMLVLLLLH